MLHSTWKRLMHAVRHGEHGQVLVLFAAGSVGMIAMLALSIDAGRLVWTRTDLQKTADAAALAAAQDLPDQGQAETTAASYVGGNTAAGLMGDTTYDVNIAGDSSSITVTVERTVPYSIASLLGLTSADISASATVATTYYIGGRGLLPFGFVANSTNSCFQGLDGNKQPSFKENVPCTIKDGAPGVGGDFGAISLDASGASEYRDNIKNGSNSYYKIGDKIGTETGNMAGPTWQGLTDRMSKPLPAECPYTSFSDVLTTQADGSVTIKGGCLDNPRLIVIPVIDKLDNPNPSTILGFAFMFLEDVGKQSGHNVVKARFLELRTELPDGLYGGSTPSGASATKLID